MSLAEGEGARCTGGKGCTGQKSSAGTLCSRLVMSSEEETRRDPGVQTSRWGEQRSRDGIVLLNLLPSGEDKRKMRVTSAILLATMLLPHICSPLFHFYPRVTFFSSRSAFSPAPEPSQTRASHTLGSISHEQILNLDFTCRLFQAGVWREQGDPGCFPLPLAPHRHRM